MSLLWLSTTCSSTSSAHHCCSPCASRNLVGPLDTSTILASPGLPIVLVPPSPPPPGAVVTVAVPAAASVRQPLGRPGALQRRRGLAAACDVVGRGLGRRRRGGAHVGQPRAQAAPHLAGRLREAPEAGGQRHGRRVEHVALHEHAFLGQRLAHLEREPGAQRVPAHAHVAGAVPARRGPQRGQRAGEAHRALEAVPGQETEVVHDVAPERGPAQQRAAERHHGGRRAGGAVRRVAGQQGLAVPLQHGAVDGAVALVHQRVGEPVHEVAPPPRRKARALVALVLPVQLQQKRSNEVGRATDQLERRRSHQLGDDRCRGPYTWNSNGFDAGAASPAAFWPGTGLAIVLRRGGGPTTVLSSQL
ncbi:hypothetical protein U9M48_018158 [Paspalum notatum var. saurae]|uniref:Uncharacterized protein n=1 Tax=Paspalum notatum var. saurae TaxID=547442 RepID=A0AAQ3TA33_PASNO